MDIGVLEKYFQLNENQKEKFNRLFDLYKSWNEKINVISRKDIDNFYLHHVLHSLSIAKFIDFKPNTKILDVGTGGGFPGIPLAILFDNVDFFLIDSIGKKIKVVNSIAEELDLKNIRTQHIRAEEVDGEFDFVVSRAVTQLDVFYSWIKNKINTLNFNDIINGVIYLKGGNIDNEMKNLKVKYKIINISLYYSEDFFIEKKIVYLN